MRIAVVEDNKPLALGIAKAFEAEGHGVDLLHEGASAVDFLNTENHDLIILDVNLPGRSGLEVLSDLRETATQTPIMMLTARDELGDKVEGLDRGADDYLTKPFELAELMARARALLRRAGKDIMPKIQLGKIEFDPAAKQILLGDELIDLPRREYALFEVLINSKGGVVSKAQILDHLYGTGADVEDSAVELYVHRLRKKLTNSGTEIKTVRGLGYCFRAL
ncbi:MAG: response regulator transcription factor [Pseudomonadota bacterium]